MIKYLGLFIIALISENVFGQEKITVTCKNQSLESVLTSVGKNYNYTFVYTKGLLKKAAPVTIQIKNASLEEFLEEVFRSQPFFFKIYGRSISIGKKGNPTIYNTVTGKVTDEKGRPAANATIEASKPAKASMTTDSGAYTLKNIPENDFLKISYIGYDVKYVKVTGTIIDPVRLQLLDSPLEAITVRHQPMSTGHQLISSIQATGSYTTLDNSLLNRRISGNIVDGLKYLSPGLLFIKHTITGTNGSSLSDLLIRGKSSIYGVNTPLIVIDNFPYDGDINNINLNDIESITILKDAAAASMWGVFSGNGVIILTTKKGRFGQSPKISLTSNITISNNPQTDNMSSLSASERIDLGKFLYDKGFYNNQLSIAYLPVPADIEIRDQLSRGVISENEAERKLNDLRLKNVDDKGYLYRKSINIQNALSIAGGTDRYQYFFSAGYDKNNSLLEGNSYNRFTFNNNNTYRFLRNKQLQFHTGITFTRTIADNNNPGNVAAGNDLRESYRDTAGRGKLLNWTYFPAREINISDNTTQLTDFRLNLGMQYKIDRNIEFIGRYQYSQGVSVQENYKSQETYYTRDLINRFTQIDPQTGVVSRPVPLGGIMDLNNSSYASHNLRTQLDFSYKWKNAHTLLATAGIEQRSITTQHSADRLYGYDPETQTSIFVNYSNLYPLFYAPFILSKIPDYRLNIGTTENYFSYFANVLYTYKQRLNFSAGLRKDMSNLFGDRINRKGFPMWSTGIGWNIDREKFYRLHWLPVLKLRLTYGYTGNIDKSLSSKTTIGLGGFNAYNAPQAYIANPANNSLSWEKILISNLGIDFSTANNRFSGSLEYFIKRGMELIADNPVDQTTGVPIFKGNTADMKNNGLEITLNTQILNYKNFKWSNTIIGSYITNKILNYKVIQSTITAYTNQLFPTPLQGKPLDALYSFRWAGLDATNGDPLGIINRQVTNNYSDIFNSTNPNDLVYHGSSIPVFFGSNRNTITWGNFEGSFIIEFRSGYYFRRKSINYFNLLTGDFNQKDYSLRWQKPGDEKITTVPSMSYPPNSSRDDFYTYSAVTVEKADQVRLQDIQAGYVFRKVKNNKPVLPIIRLNLYLNNIGIIWKANRQHIDPDYIDNTREPLTIAAGFKIDF